MEIWIFNHYAISGNSIGITRHYDLAKYLVSRGHNVKIFASSFNHQTRKEEHLENKKDIYKVAEIEGVEFVWIKTTPYRRNNIKRIFNILSYTIRVNKLSKKFKSKPDIVLGSLFHPLAVVVARKVAKRNNSLFYFEERDFWPQTMVDFGKISKNNPIAKLLYKLEKSFYKDADRIILLFEQAKNYVISKGENENKMLYLPNGVDFQRNNKKTTLDREMEMFFQLKRDKIISIYLGTHGLANNLDCILDAAKTLKNTENEFVFVGDGPEKERLIQRKNNENIENVHFFNPISKDEVSSVLKYADIGLLPLKESPVFKFGISPNKLYDYMVNKLPVLLLCDLDNSPVEKYDAGYIIRNNFSANIAKFYKNLNQAELKLKGFNGYESVVEYHDWNKLAGKLEKVILEDLHNKKGLEKNV